MIPQPNLSDVTVCVADSVYPDLAARALWRCRERCRFADVVLFSDVPVAGPFRRVTIDRLTSLGDYSRFCLKRMVDWIETPYVLVVQWDGYITDANAWDDKFRDYDYIGAPIFTRNGSTVVGNGGFSWRSRKLLAALKTLPLVSRHNEDWIISVIHREALERDFGIVFAPVELATRFSYEQRHPNISTFGFHGQSNLWRHEDDAEVIRMMRLLPQQALLSLNFMGLVINCLRRDRHQLARALYRMIRVQRDPAGILALMGRAADEKTVASMIAALESDYLGDATA